jgi:hypothetical protein
MSRPTLQTTLYDMSPPTLQTTGGKDPYTYNTTQHKQHNTTLALLYYKQLKINIRKSTTQHKQHQPSYTTNNWRERPVQVQHNRNNAI